METLRFDLGTFEGFNFRDQCAIFKRLSADNIINWDHDGDGEAEFWPAGDNDGVQLLFRRGVTASELVALEQLLIQLDGDSIENYLRIHHVLDQIIDGIEKLTAADVEDTCSHVFVGTSFCELRRDAAYELFELYYPEAYEMWEQTNCDGLIFDTDRFLDSPSWAVEEIDLHNRKALIIAPN